MLIIPIKNKTLNPPELEKFIPVIEEESKITKDESTIKDESLRLYKINNNDTDYNTIVQEEQPQTLLSILNSKKFLSCFVMAFCTTCNYYKFINNRFYLPCT